MSHNIKGNGKHLTFSDRVSCIKISISIFVISTKYQSSFSFEKEQSVAAEMPLKDAK